ncbi:hypothetical protein JHL18_07825 [Clostridium sp. YIM B02505]|uniref:Uncharacterized protein n=1 Tax=Clostridium yunnanense TaxID=2800325 RepID=A0ABS1EMD9_9CLOT|nr:hypothetical protein [Clostridium yunnanense]MBK1810542.1 hypothetical protein [Clostridium yunnanense]
MSFILIIGDALVNTTELSSKDTLDASVVRKITEESNAEIASEKLKSSIKYRSLHNRVLGNLSSLLKTKL